jgi:hypothetical protein
MRVSHRCRGPRKHGDTADSRLPYWSKTGGGSIRGPMHSAMIDSTKAGPRKHGTRQPGTYGTMINDQLRGPAVSPCFRGPRQPLRQCLVTSGPRKHGTRAVSRDGACLMDKTPLPAAPKSACQETGGNRPAAMSSARNSTRSDAFSARTATVARPHCVRPTIVGPSKRK